MSKVSVLLVYEVPGGRPLTVARTEDPEIVKATSSIVLREAETRAEALAEADEILGLLERAEVGRLKQVLRLLAPEALVGAGRDSDVPVGVM